MKKITAFIVVFAMFLSLAACGQKDYSVVYGKSEIYTKKDMDSAIAAIMKSFNAWDTKCTMYSISYAGDDRVTQENLEYCNSLSQKSGIVYDECIVFESSFHTPKLDSQAFTPDETYTGWTWYLARVSDGNWVVLTSGYA